MFVLTPYLKHVTRLTTAAAQATENYIKRTFPTVSKFTCFTDNAKQHFRTNAYIRSMSDRCLHDGILRHQIYHCLYHGKTVGDSAGGHLKSHLGEVTKIKVNFNLLFFLFVLVFCFYVCDIGKHDSRFR